MGGTIGTVYWAASNDVDVQQPQQCHVCMLSWLTPLHLLSDPRQVAFCEWIEPIFPGGHWTPQLIHMAGEDQALAAVSSCALTSSC